MRDLSEVARGVIEAEKRPGGLLAEQTTGQRIAQWFRDLAEVLTRPIRAAGLLPARALAGRRCKAPSSSPNPEPLRSAQPRAGEK